MEKSLLSLTANDLMSRGLVLVPLQMSLHGAARLLARARVSGAPVVDDAGRCVGVISTTDILRWVEDGQPRRKSPANHEAVCQPWQMVGALESAADCVGDHMTRDPVVVSAGTKIGELSRMMMDARIHRVVVIDSDEHPIGIVSTTDILAAVARESIAENVYEESRQCTLPAHRYEAVH